MGKLEETVSVFENLEELVVLALLKRIWDKPKEFNEYAMRDLPPYHRFRTWVKEYRRSEEVELLWAQTSKRQSDTGLITESEYRQLSAMHEDMVKLWKKRDRFRSKMLKVSILRGIYG